MNRILIDTNIYSGAMRGDSEIVGVLRQVEFIGVSAISIGELLSGFKGGRRETENRKELGAFLDSPRVTLFSVDEYTASHYCSILDQLRRHGTPIPTNDIWIAAIAIEHSLVLYSRDAHFDLIPSIPRIG